MLAIEEAKSLTFRWYRYTETAPANPDFDGEAFRLAWLRRSGSVHRYYVTGELVLCGCTDSPYPQERERLRELLESHPGNVAAVLGACDASIDRWNRAVDAMNVAAAGGEG